jgi:hypothetical protein
VRCDEHGDELYGLLREYGVNHVFDRVRSDCYSVAVESCFES